MREQTTERMTSAREAGYTRLPYSMFKPTDGRVLRGCAADLLGLIYSYSDVKEDPDAACKLSYDGFRRTLNVSRATVARQLKKFFEHGFITKDTSNPFHNTYTYAGAATSKPYITIEHDLYDMPFDFRDGRPPRTLSKPEIRILSHIKTHCDNEDGDGVCRGSARGFAAALGLSKNTVLKALSSLMQAKLIYRVACGVNNHKRAAYKYNPARLRSSRKAYKKSIRASAASTAADERSERGLYYAALQQQESARVNRIRTALDADPVYRALETEYKPLGKSIAFAELYHPGDVEALKRKRAALSVRMSERLADLGISADELEPHYTCSKCRDTGFTVKEGRLCDCYPDARRRSP